MNWAATLSMNAIDKPRRSDWFDGWRNWATRSRSNQLLLLFESYFQKSVKVDGVPTYESNDTIAHQGNHFEFFHLLGEFSENVPQILQVTIQ